MHLNRKCGFLFVDKATNPNNIGDNNSYATEFAIQVNKEFDGYVLEFFFKCNSMIFP